MAAALNKQNMQLVVAVGTLVDIMPIENLRSLALLIS